MQHSLWSDDGAAHHQLDVLLRAAADCGVLVVEFEASGSGVLPFRSLEKWGASRALTVADIRCPLASPGLEVALGCDLVYLRPACHLELPAAREIPSPGLIWACGRASRRALRRLMLLDPEHETAVIPPKESVDLELAIAVLENGQKLPLPSPHSTPALTAARDLMRARPDASGALELASFRLLFASGDPGEGACAFLEDRAPDFST